MAFTLGPRAAETGYRLAAYDTIGSTNSEALARARAGDRGPLWIVARTQTAGRGRRGRGWSTAEGNLAASLLLHCRVPLTVAATLGFVAGLALKDALALCAPGLPVQLKWPNDVLVSGRGKLAGILLESEPLDGGVVIAVGIGVNVGSAPDGLPYPATSLADLGKPVTPQTLFTALSDAWVGTAQDWNLGKGLPSIRRQWLEHAAGRGERVAVQMGERVARGVFETIDDDGRLILRSDDGSPVAIAAGEVYFGDAAGMQPARETG